MKIETMEAKTELSEMNPSKIVSKAEWLVARKDLLTREKELTRLRDELSRHRRQLPMVKIDKEYIFDGPDGKETLADLFDGNHISIVRRALSSLREGPHRRVEEVVGANQDVETKDIAVVPFACRSLTFDGELFWTNYRAEDTIVSFVLPN